MPRVKGVVYRSLNIRACIVDRTHRNVLTVAAAISAVILPPANTLGDLYLNAVCAEHLVHELRVAGMEVVRAAPERLRE
jgi:hypothetical protein